MRRALSRAGERGGAKAFALTALLLITLAACAGQPVRPAGPDHDSESYQIKMEVALVVLHATVTDRQGGFVSSLVKQDFEVYEDGMSQRIRLFENEDVPVSVGLVIDHSTTMQPKLAEVSAAARTFVRASNQEDETFVVNFNENVSLGLPETIRFTNSTSELENAINTAPTSGQTALYDATAKGLAELQAGTRDKKVLIVISDGGDTASALSLSNVIKMAEQSSAVIYTIGIFDEKDPDQNPGVLKRLAQVTGGEAFLPDRFSEVVPICEHIARDIRHQYTIGYVPANPARNGAYHTVRVVARAKGHDKLFVRTRTGYTSRGGSQPDEKSAK
jgi:Ca-activated chloride channel homolog